MPACLPLSVAVAYAIMWHTVNRDNDALENLVYLREAPGLPIAAEQQAILRAAGVRGVDPDRDRAYLDNRLRGRAGRDASGLPERDRLLTAIRKGEGDVVHVAMPGVLAVSQEDAAKVLRRIMDKGASLHVATLGLTVGPGDGVAVMELAVSIAKAAGKARTARAREKRSLAAKVPPPERMKATALAKEMWEAETPEGYPTHTVAEIEKIAGISASTLYRAQRGGLLKARRPQPLSIRIALANAAKGRKRKVTR